MHGLSRVTAAQTAAIRAHSLDDNERIRLIERIANALSEGTIGAREGKLLTRQLINPTKGR